MEPSLVTSTWASLLSGVRLARVRAWRAWDLAADGARLIVVGARKGLTYGPVLAGRAALRVAQWLRGIWHLTVATFPLPSESKWHGLVEMVALLLQTILRRTDTGADASGDALKRSLEELGRQWATRRIQWIRTAPPIVPEVRSTLVLAFKTLDMPTTFTVRGPVLKTVTTGCPFLQEALTQGTAPRVCQILCSENHSFFRGIVTGLPFHVTYQSPAMMGNGDPVCVKVFELVRPSKGEGSLSVPVERALAE